MWGHSRKVAICKPEPTLLAPWYWRLEKIDLCCLNTQSGISWCQPKQMKTPHLILTHHFLYNTDKCHPVWGISPYFAEIIFAEINYFVFLNDDVIQVICSFVPITIIWLKIVSPTLGSLCGIIFNMSNISGSNFEDKYWKKRFASLLNFYVSTVLTRSKKPAVHIGTMTLCLFVIPLMVFVLSEINCCYAEKVSTTLLK